MVTIPFDTHDNFMDALYRKYKTDAGYDIYTTKNVFMWPLATKKVPLNIYTDIPDNYFGLLVNRSSTGNKGLLIHPGVIDPHYTGQYHAVVTNVSRRPQLIKAGTRLVQLLVFERTEVDFKKVLLAEMPQYIDITERGTAGFGSTGQY